MRRKEGLDVVRNISAKAAELKSEEAKLKENLDAEAKAAMGRSVGELGTKSKAISLDVSSKKLKLKVLGDTILDGELHRNVAASNELAANVQLRNRRPV